MGHNRREEGRRGPPQSPARAPPHHRGSPCGPELHPDERTVPPDRRHTTAEVRATHMTENVGTRNGSAPTNVPVLREGVASYLADPDPEETQEWMDSLDGLLAAAGPERARYLMLRLLERASKRRVPLPALTSTDYVNTIPTA